MPAGGIGHEAFLNGGDPSWSFGIQSIRTANR
jgi:hypothetical protein